MPCCRNSKWLVNSAKVHDEWEWPESFHDVEHKTHLKVRVPPLFPAQHAPPSSNGKWEEAFAFFPSSKMVESNVLGDGAAGCERNRSSTPRLRLHHKETFAMHFPAPVSTHCIIKDQIILGIWINSLSTPTWFRKEVPFLPFARIMNAILCWMIQDWNSAIISSEVSQYAK